MKPSEGSCQLNSVITAATFFTMYYMLFNLASFSSHTCSFRSFWSLKKRHQKTINVCLRYFIVAFSSPFGFQIHDHMWHICYSLSFRFLVFRNYNHWNVCCEAKSFHKATRKSHGKSLLSPLFSPFPLYIHPVDVVTFVSRANDKRRTHTKNQINIPYTIAHKVKTKG